MFDIDTESEFERRLLTDVIPPNELNVSFEDIGALDHVKEALRELVMLPLQRPELFRKGNLTRPTKVKKIENLSKFHLRANLACYF